MERNSFVDKQGDNDIKKAIAELTAKMDHKTLAIWAADCAEHVLSHFNDLYPDDSRPRKAIEAGRAWVRGEISVGDARSAALAAHAAARDADEGVARAVARATGHAAGTAHVAGHAIHAANYAASAIAGERTWQYQHLLDLRDNH
jgi:hypothetical protein